MPFGNEGEGSEAPSKRRARDATARLVFENASPVHHKIARQCPGDPDLVKDLEQEVWYRVLAGITRRPPPDREAAWVAGIVRYVCVDAIRARQRNRRLASAVHLLSMSEATELIRMTGRMSPSSASPPSGVGQLRHRRTRTRRLTAARPACALLLSALAPAPLGGQVVRGTVTERGTQAPLPGVIVSLLPVDTSGQVARDDGRSALTNPAGEYAIRAAGTGKYILSVKRIGVRRLESGAFDLAIGETRRMDLIVDRLAYYSLPEVRVATITPCVTRREEASRVAALFDDVRAALAAAEISRRDSLVQGKVTLYSRSLVPGTFLVAKESRSEHSGLVDRPFQSIGADSLSRSGYWRRLPGDSVAFYGLDGAILSSATFLREHCFHIVQDPQGHPGSVGLAFEPVKRRSVPDVQGTVWLSARARQLQSVEFGYTRLPRAANIRGVGGEVYFRSLPNGAWLLSRWLIRIPQFGVYTIGPSPELSLSWRTPEVYRLSEGGGFVQAEGIGDSVTMHAVAGTVTDSAGAVLHDAVVHIVGTEWSATTDTQGRFSIGGLMTGRYRLIATAPGYTSLGIPAADAEVSVDTGASSRIALRAADADAIATTLCGNGGVLRTRAVLHLTVTRETESTPVASTKVRLSWTELIDLHDGFPPHEIRTHHADEVTDGRGATTFCDVPPDTTVSVLLPSNGSGEFLRMADFRLRQGEIRAETIWLPESDTTRHLPQQADTAIVAGPGASAAARSSARSTVKLRCAPTSAERPERPRNQKRASLSLVNRVVQPALIPLARLRKSSRGTTPAPAPATRAAAATAPSP